MASPSEAPSKTLLSFKELASFVATLRQDGKRVVHSHGAFDPLHPGHIRHLQAARRQGDALVVTVKSDSQVKNNGGRPVLPDYVRAETLLSLACVDTVAVCEESSTSSVIRAIQPDVYAEGSDRADAASDGLSVSEEERNAAASIGATFITTEPQWNARALNNPYNGYPEETRAFLREFRKRYSVSDVLASLERIRPLRVLLIGDAVIDEYQYVRSLGKTSKTSIIANQILDAEAFIGGVFACANHVANFCDTVHVVTALGRKDTREAFIREHLKPNVTMHAVYRDDAPTTIKRRFLDANFLNKLFEVYDFNDAPLSEQVQNGLHGHLRSVLPEYDVVICLDYLHGLISAQTTELLTSASRFLAVNTQTNAGNVGYNPVTRYARADYICIDEPEMRLATLDRYGSVESLLVRLAERLLCRKAIGTRGHRGCLAFEADRGLFPIPVFSRNVVDAVGAGDAFLALTAPCVAAGLPMELVGFIGNVVGSQAVMIVGNRTAVEPMSVRKAIQSLLG